MADSSSDRAGAIVLGVAARDAPPPEAVPVVKRFSSRLITGRRVSAVVSVGATTRPGNASSRRSGTRSGAMRGGGLGVLITGGGSLGWTGVGVGVGVGIDVDDGGTDGKDEAASAGVAAAIAASSIVASNVTGRIGVRAGEWVMTLALAVVAYAAG